MHKILIIDDDKDIRSVLSDLVKSGGYETFTAGNGKTALKEISTHCPDMVLLDVKLPGVDGMTILERIRNIDRNIAIIMLTAYGDIRDAVKAMKLGAFDYITKPFENDEILSLIKKALQARPHTNYSPSTALSLREKEVLNWLKQGKSSWELASILMIGESTVNFHITNIMHKLNAVSRVQAVAIAIEQGLINSE
ncbi:MAG: DNA-binding response regulator [Nitrospiraceae bacterium]|nr:MAG: DNA-binding response regulator [Nitrospiraceae bacterium]